MYLLYGLLILAMIFFLVLPITDARTARMKLSVVSSLGALLAISIMLPRLIYEPGSARPDAQQPAPAEGGRRRERGAA